MTYGQILARVSVLVWGSSPADPETVGFLYGSEGVIANAVRELQRDYNYWFMQANTALDVQGFVQSYDVPADFKEFRAAMWKYDDEDGFSLPLKLVSTAVGIEKWNSDDSDSSEYPEYIEMNGDSFTLYPDPNPNYPLVVGDTGYDATLTRELHILYWAYLARPSAVTATFDAYEDAMSIHGAEAVIDLAAAYMCELNSEYDRGVLFRNRASMAVDNLKKEDKRRRQKSGRMVLPMNHNRPYRIEV